MSMATDGKVIVLEKRLLELQERVRKLEAALAAPVVATPAAFKPERATRLG